jgi:hypothetical protein
MRARGQGLLTLVLLGAVALGAVGLDRLGTKGPAQAQPGEASSGAWFCPHGGGPDWQATLSLANPGEADVVARLTSLGEEGSKPGTTVTVPAGGEVRVEAPATERGSSSYVEYFGGWIAAGWVARGSGDEIGIGAEPCAPAAGRSWFSAGVSTGQGEQGFLVVMNPFAADAVFDVAIFAAGREPVRHQNLTDFTLRPGRSVGIKLNGYAEGESAMGVEVQTSTGRVAAATTVVSKASGITSVLASPATSDAAYMPVRKGTGQSILSLTVPTERGSVAAGLLLTGALPRPVGELTGTSLEPAAAAIFPVVSNVDASIDVSVQEGDQVIAAIRTSGLGNDDAATAGAVEPATAWVVPPTLAGEPAKPSLLLANPGDVEAVVTLRLLPLDGGEAAEVTVRVPAAKLVEAPANFLAGAPDASVLVTSDGAPIVALGSTTSLGTKGLSVFGSAMGVPIPPQNG